MVSTLEPIDASAVESYQQTPEMGKKRKELSEAEIWDDSALLRSWDDALVEYKVIPPPNIFSFFSKPIIVLP